MQIGGDGWRRHREGYKRDKNLSRAAVLPRDEYLKDGGDMRGDRNGAKKGDTGV